jgi:hypothetical protein
VRKGVPEKGDLRYPTLGGTIFVGVFLGLAGSAQHVAWTGIWPFIPAAPIFIYLLVAISSRCESTSTVRTHGRSLTI